MGLALATTTILAVACLLAAMPAPARAVTLKVPSQYPNIRAAVQAALPGDSVLVAPGTYSGTGNTAINFNGKALVVFSEAGPATTIIQPGVQAEAFAFHSGETPAAVVKGFTLSAAYSAITCMGSSPTILDCVLRENWGEGGGALKAADASPTFIDCHFIENSAMGGGGAILMVRGALTLTNCTFVGNRVGMVFAPSQGGALAVDNAQVTISGCTFTDNHATATHPGWHPGPGGTGGAIALSGTGTITNCQFTGNSARSEDVQSSDGFGGALAVGGDFVLKDCTFSDNFAEAEGGAVTLWGGSSTFENCVFARNEASDGGAVNANGGSRQFVGCTFVENRALRGGGVVAYGSSSELTLERCLLVRNRANFGGGVAVHTIITSIMNCTFYQNEASDPLDGGAGIHLTFAGSVSIGNTIIAASPVGQAVSCMGECCVVTMTCSDIHGNAGGDYVDCISGLLGVDGNQTADPLFCDASSDDYTLDANSPCAPGNAPAGCGLVGAFDVACGLVGIAEPPTLASHPELRIAPNPVRVGAPLILSGLGTGARVEIVNAAGRVIETLSSSASTTIRWHPDRSLPSGVYFARVSDGIGGPARFVLVR